MITREQVADFQPGDVVELVDDRWPDVTVRGPLREAQGYLQLGNFALVAYADGGNRFDADHYEITVVSRAPRPLYVNHPRTEPVPGDVVRDADDDGNTLTWSPATVCAAEDKWWENRFGARHFRSELPARLRLLVDGETGQVVP